MKQTLGNILAVAIMGAAILYVLWATYMDNQTSWRLP